MSDGCCLSAGWLGGIASPGLAALKLSQGWADWMVVLRMLPICCVPKLERLEGFPGFLLRCWNAAAGKEWFAKLGLGRDKIDARDN